MAVGGGGASSEVGQCGLPRCSSGFGTERSFPSKLWALHGQVLLGCTGAAHGLLVSLEAKTNEKRSGLLNRTLPWRIA